MTESLRPDAFDARLHRLLEGAVDFGPGAGTTSFTSAGSMDIFVLKLDNSGGFLWAKAVGGTVYDAANAIAT